MKVAVLILAVLVASSSAGLLDGPLAVVFANSNLKKFGDAVNVEISALFDIFVSVSINQVSILVQIGQNFVVLVTSFGTGAAQLIVTVTADAVEFAAYVALNYIPTSIAQFISAEYNAVIVSIRADVVVDIAALNLLVLTGQVKYSCLQKAQVYINGNITEFTAEIRQKRDEHNKKMKDQADALSKQINDDSDAYKKNITDTCGGRTASAEAGCSVDQYLILRPEIKEKNKGYVKKAKDDADSNIQDARTKSQELRASFNVRYNKIKADIKKCSA